MKKASEMLAFLLLSGSFRFWRWPAISRLNTAYKRFQRRHADFQAIRVQAQRVGVLRDVVGKIRRLRYPLNRLGAAV